MTISKRDQKLLLCLAGILIFLALYMLVYSKFNEKTAAVQAETAALMPELQELQTHKASEAIYQAGIEECRLSIAELGARFPNDIRTEDKIMFASDMERSLGLIVSAASFSEPVSVMDFSGIAEQEDGSYLTVPVSACYSGSSLSCSMTYPVMKAAVDHLYAQNDLTALEALSISYDSATGELFGTMNIQQYFLTGLDGTYYPTATPSRPMGTDNVFGTVTTAQPAPPVTPAEPAAPATPAAP